MFGVSNILEHTDVFQLFLTPAAPQFAIRDQFDLQCEHVSVQVEDDWTPREIGRSVESDRWKFWTAYKWRKERESNAYKGFPLYNYHHDPYNFSALLGRVIKIIFQITTMRNHQNLHHHIYVPTKTHNQLI